MPGSIRLVLDQRHKYTHTHTHTQLGNAWLLGVEDNAKQPVRNHH